MQGESESSKSKKAENVGNSYRKLQADLDHQYYEWVTVPTQRYISERKEEEAFAHQRRQKLIQEALERDEEIDA